MRWFREAHSMGPVNREKGLQTPSRTYSQRSNFLSLRLCWLDLYHLETHSVVISASTHSFLMPRTSSPSPHPWGAQPTLIPYSLTHKRAIFLKKQKLSKSIGVMKEDTQKYTPFPYPTEHPHPCPPTLGYLFCTFQH